jgi:MFS family permease
VLLYAAVPDGPYLRRSPRIDPRGIALIWRDPGLRAPALGYFGHMCELFAFWTLVPAILATRLEGAAVSAASFAVIAAGFLGCAIGGVMALRAGSARVAFAQLATSASCCLLAPLMLDATGPAFAGWLFVWGVTVVGDSPQFSALTARNAPPRLVGSLLTFVNSIGFGLTAVLIPAFTALAATLPLAQVLPLLAIGPAAGLLAMGPLLREGGDPG